jgi:hypothetical protein
MVGGGKTYAIRAGESREPFMRVKADEALSGKKSGKSLETSG